MQRTQGIARDAKMFFSPCGVCVTFAGFAMVFNSHPKKFLAKTQRRKVVFENTNNGKNANDIWKSWLFFRKKLNDGVYLCVSGNYSMNIQNFIALFFSFLAMAGCKQSKLQVLDRADLLAGKGKYDEAIKLCNKLLSEDSTLQMAYYQRGIYYTNIKEYSKAISDFDKIILSKTNGQKVFLEMNKESEFASDEDKLTVYMTEATFMRGVAKYLAGSLNSSLNDFSYCIENNYKQASCYSWLGSIYVNKNDKEKACEMYAKAINLGDDEAQKLRDKYCK